MLMSVFETCRRQTLSVVDSVSRMLRWFGNRPLPRPVLLPGPKQYAVHVTVPVGSPAAG